MKNIAEIIRERFKKKYKLTRLMLESFGWVFLIGIFAGIWIEQYRWRLIFTALFSLLMVIFLTAFLMKKEEEVK